jgi:hypothetical protein
LIGEVGVLSVDEDDDVFDDDEGFVVMDEREEPREEEEEVSFNRLYFVRRSVFSRLHCSYLF